MAFTLQVHPEAQPWQPSPQMLARLQSFFDEPSMTLHLLPRRLADSTLGKPNPKHTYRAFTRGRDSYVFVDPTETKESVAWIMAHELTHQMVDRSPTLEAAFHDAMVPGEDRAGDRFHHVDPEERFCDGIATNLVGKRLDRDWWRARTKDPRLIDNRTIDRRAFRRA